MASCLPPSDLALLKSTPLAFVMRPDHNGGGPGLLPQLEGRLAPHPVSKKIIVWPNLDDNVLVSPGPETIVFRRVLSGDLGGAGRSTA